MSEFINTNNSTLLDSENTLLYGEPLKQARLSAGLGITEVASTLKLKRNIIEFIERSAIDNLPPVLYFHGYLRAYAKYLKVPEEAVIDNFNNAVPSDVPELCPNFTLADTANSNTFVIKCTTWLLISIATVFVLYEIYTYYNNVGNQLDSNTQTTIKTTPLQFSQDEVIYEDGTFVVVSPEKDEDPVEITSTEYEEVVESDVSGGDAEEASSSSYITDLPDTIIVNNYMDITTEKDTWLEISDVNGDRLYYGTIDANGYVHVSGKAPFELFIGNAPSAQITINDKAVDLIRFIRSNKTARLTVSVNNDQIIYH